MSDFQQVSRLVLGLFRKLLVDQITWIRSLLVCSWKALSCSIKIGIDRFTFRHWGVNNSSGLLVCIWVLLLSLFLLAAHKGISGCHKIHVWLGLHHVKLKGSSVSFPETSGLSCCFCCFWLGVGPKITIIVIELINWLLILIYGRVVFNKLS